MSKFFLKSKGFVATALGILIYAASELFGIVPEPVTEGIVVEVVTILALLIGLYGRWVAKEPLTVKKDS